MTSYITETKKTSVNAPSDNRSHNKTNSNTGEIKNNGTGANNKLHWTEADKNHACPMCHKNDWCYLGFDGTSLEMVICGRPPVTVDDEWIAFGETTDDRIKYRRKLPEKTYRPAQTREWIYTDIEGNPIAKQIRWDYPDKDKEIRRQYYVDGEWVWKLPKHLDNKAFNAKIAPFNWEEVDAAIAKDELVIIAEGEPAVEAWRKLGFTATTFISGKWNDCYRDYFIGAKVVYSPDGDQIGVKLMDKVANAISGVISDCQWFYVYPNNHLWQKLPQNHGVDMKDFLDDYPEMSPEDIRGMFEADRRYFEKIYRQPSFEDSRAEKAVAQSTNKAKENDDKPTRLNKKELLAFIRNNCNLRYNVIERIIEVNGEELTIEPYLYLLDHHDIDCGKDTATDMMMMVAKERSYNPVKEYLDKISTITTPTDISNLATRFFGTSNPLYDKFVEKMLIGAVARIYDPGCKLDTALVLQGEQGIGKSSFFDVLGGDYFDDSMGNGSDKDDLLTLHRSWIQEWGELDRIFGKKAVGEVKQFLSKRRDNFREPYARKTETFNRHSIIVGSVNDAQFLNDNTGSRRFWVIPIEVDEIDIEQLKRDRDSIWAAAVNAYKQGQRWWLSKQEQLESAANNDQFQIRDEWETIIQDYLENRERTTVSELLSEALDFNPKDMGKADQARVSNALKSLGWIKGGRQTYQGKRQPVWQCPKNGSGGTATKKATTTYAMSETSSQSVSGTGGSDGSGNEQTLNKAMDKQTDNSTPSNNSDFNKVAPQVDPPDPQPTETPTKPESEEVAQVDNGGEPAMTSDPDDDHIEYLKALMLNAPSKESLTELKREYFSEDDIKQIWAKMTIEERAKVKAIANQ